MDIADPEVVQKNNATDATQETPQLGSDRYRVLSTLGAGGMGVVYLAEDLKLHRKVAVKKLRDDIASQNARERIQQEARLLAQLNHPNIVALHDVLEDTAGNDTSVALVMEYIEGTTLRAWMRERGPSLQQKLSLLMQICLGLQQAHDLGIIHRDLKADNILIAENAKREPVAKITDFGIAKSQQLDEKTLTAENQLAGTITAMSPEQILGKTLTARSDLFSLGAIAYELLCGRRPFEKHEGGALAMANRITSEPHIPPQQTWAGIPEPLAVLLDKLLAKEPAQRPESAQIVYQGFALLHKQGMETEAEDFTATLTDLFTQQKVKSRRRWQRITTGVAATLVLGAGSYWGWKEITRLEPQYIAVMPVEINGEIRGEENAKALTKTMVRQALMNSVSHLKASALVSFTPREEQNFEAQLQKLKDKGVTDALFARLECAEIRCEIEVQRLSPNDSQIKGQTSFTFLANKNQEAQYRTSNSTTRLFASSYHRGEPTSTPMLGSDYDIYLDVLSRMEAKNLNAKNLSDLIALSNRYPHNPYLYQAVTDAATRIFILDGNHANLEAALQALEKADNFGVTESLIIQLKLFIYGLGDYREQYDLLISKIEAADLPLAESLSEQARHYYRGGDYELGIKFAREAADLNPSADNLYLVAINQTASGDYSNARTTLNILTEKHPEHWSSYSLLGVIELESGNFSAAESNISKIPKNLRGWRTKSNLATTYFLQQKYAKALENFQEVVKLVPEDVSTLQQIAETKLALGNNIEAKKYFELVIKLTEGSREIESQQNRAVAFANIGKIEEAISLITRLLRTNPDDTFITYAASQVYSLAGEQRSANLHISNLLKQGMSAEWFNLPVFQQLCAQPQVSDEVKEAICD